MKVSPELGGEQFDIVWAMKAHPHINLRFMIGVTEGSIALIAVKCTLKIFNAYKPPYLELTWHVLKHTPQLVTFVFCNKFHPSRPELKRFHNICRGQDLVLNLLRKRGTAFAMIPEVETFLVEIKKLWISSGAALGSRVLIVWTWPSQV